MITARATPSWVSTPRARFHSRHPTPRASTHAYGLAAGYASNVEPSYIIPSVIGTKDAKSSARKEWKGVEDMDFWIGDEAVSRSNEYTVNYPIRHGIVENWDNMERYWQRCIFKYMRCDPEEHAFLLTEPPMCRLARAVPRHRRWPLSTHLAPSRAGTLPRTANSRRRSCSRRST